MVSPKFWQKLAICVGLLSPTVVSLAAVPSQLLAQESSEMSIALSFPPPPQTQGAPTSTAAGGTRGEGESFRVQDPTTALMPTWDDGEKTLTTAAHPTFFVYVPETNGGKSAEFVLVDDNWNVVHQKILQLPSGSGVVQVKLPETAPALEIGKNYYWQLAILFDRDQGIDEEIVGGTIERTSLPRELQGKLLQLSPVEQAELYAEQRIWQDALTVMAQSRSGNETEWKELLKSVGLGNISSEPLLECCTAVQISDAQWNAIE